MTDRFHNEGYEFRQVKPEEMKEFLTVEGYVFGETEEITDDKVEKNPMKYDMTNAVFHKGQLVATTAGFPFKMRLNGHGVFVDGVTAVGTLPDHRRRGLVRRTITDRLHMAKEREQPAAILYASMAAIYQRFGYGLGNMVNSYAIDPRFADFEFEVEDLGTTKLMDVADALEAIKKIYRTFLEDRTLMLHRTDIHWDRFKKTKTPTFVALHSDENSQPDGYITYRLGEFRRPENDPGPDMAINVWDFYCLNHVAYRALWKFMRSHDLAGRITMRTATDDIAPYLLLEPRNLRVRAEDGLWLRVVDIPTLLKQRGYQAEGRLVFDVNEDVECPWNVGTWELEASPDGSIVKKSSKSPDFGISINGLASLITGQARLSTLVKTGRAELRSSLNLNQADALFSTMHAPYCGDGF